jgi:predicted DCC family thiol-disulfide oxidoreductase YuxK
MTHERIVFFDGICGLCSKSVDLLLKLDTRKRLLFAPLQGQTAEKRCHPEQLADVDSIIYLRNRVVYEKSTAVLLILSDLGGRWPICRMFLVVPAPIRDAMYNYVAKRRYRWFGIKDSCRVPTASEKARFLP